MANSAPPFPSPCLATLPLYHFALGVLPRPIHSLFVVAAAAAGAQEFFASQLPVEREIGEVLVEQANRVVCVCVCCLRILSTTICNGKFNFRQRQ